MRFLLSKLRIFLFFPIPYLSQPQIYDRGKDADAGLSFSPEGEMACQPDGMNDRL